VKRELGLKKGYPTCLKIGGPSEETKSPSISALSTQKEKKPSTSDVDCEGTMEENKMM
jgi:hypothetical protein